MSAGPVRTQPPLLHRVKPQIRRTPICIVFILHLVMRSAAHCLTALCTKCSASTEPIEPTECFEQTAATVLNRRLAALHRRRSSAQQLQHSRARPRAGSGAAPPSSSFSRRRVLALHLRKFTRFARQQSRPPATARQLKHFTSAIHSTFSTTWYLEQSRLCCSSAPQPLLLESGRVCCKRQCIAARNVTQHRGGSG